MSQLSTTDGPVAEENRSYVGTAALRLSRGAQLGAYVERALDRSALSLNFLLEQSDRID
jgi:hypothetical protein